MEEEEAPAATAKTKPLPIAEMIIKALSVTRTRVGTSDFLRNALGAGGYDVAKNKNKINKCLRSLVEQGIVIRTKGSGAIGTFKLNKEFEIQAKKKAVAMAKKADAIAKKKEIAKKNKEAFAQRREAKKRNLGTSASAGRKSARIQSMIRTSDG